MVRDNYLLNNLIFQVYQDKFNLLVIDFILLIIEELLG
jgi:hypothetical protein